MKFAEYSWLKFLDTEHYLHLYSKVAMYFKQISASCHHAFWKPTKDVLLNKTGRVSMDFFKFVQFHTYLFQKS